jgi:hypothetical protein
LTVNTLAGSTVDVYPAGREYPLSKERSSTVVTTEGLMIISGGELARRAGVSKQRISGLTKAGKLRRVEEGGSLGYDDSDPAVRYYIDHPSSLRTSCGGPRAEGSSPEGGEPQAPADPGQEEGAKSDESREVGRSSGANRQAATKKPRRANRPSGTEAPSDYQARKDKGMAEKYELHNRILRHRYLPVEDVRRVFGKIYATHTGILRPLDAKLADQLAAEFGNQDPEKTLRAQKILSEEIYGALSQIKREIDDFLKAEEEHVVDESEELMPEPDE